MLLRDGTTGYGNWLESAYDHGIEISKLPYPYNASGTLPMVLAVSMYTNGVNTGILTTPQRDAKNYPLCERWD